MNKTQDPQLRQLSDEFSVTAAEINQLGNQLDTLKSDLDQARSERDSLFKQMNSARDEMNAEFESMAIQRDENQAKWDAYRSILDRNNPEIDSLKRQADNLARDMKDAFSRSQNAWRNGNKGAAKSYSDDGKRYQSDLTDINRRISQLCAENSSAKPNNQGVSNWRFLEAKQRFEEIKSRFDKAKDLARELSARRERILERLKYLRDKKSQIKDRQQARISELKAERDKKHREKGSNWHELQFGTIDGHEVWFRQHKFKDEILIADASQVGPNGEGFDSDRRRKIKGRHVHYGKKHNAKGNFIQERGKHYRGPGF